MTYHYPITIRHIFISPGHNYFGRPKDGPGDQPTVDTDAVVAHAGRGLVGDRYYGVPAHFSAQVTFFAAEVWDALQATFGRAGGSRLDTPILTRRNIITAGANLNQLIGREFELVCGDDRVRLAGAKPCSPCAWMDAMLAPGAHAFLRGRGGLRGQILTDGVIRRGPATLISPIPLDATTLAAPLSRPALP